MRDFTRSAYYRLLDVIQSTDYSFQTFGEYIQNSQQRVVVLRHDVDKRPLNSLKFAEIENQKGLRSSCYFRIVPESFDTKIVTQINDLGHEIGYHYEDLDLCNGAIDKAYQSFQKNLARLREIAPVETICMHGSPLSRYDNRDIWKKYDYRNDGIIGEPYFDLDFSKVFYITDTGRKWNQDESSIRDKVQTPLQFQIINTEHLIQMIKRGELPDQLMINTHPQRWTNNLILWTRELVWQTAKNQVKKTVVKRRRGDYKSGEVVPW